MTNGSGHNNGDDGSAMMGRESGYHSSTRTCMPPATLPGTLVQVKLADMGMTTMMGGVAPMGARMRLRSSTTHVAAGTVTLVVSNLGWRTHELRRPPARPGRGRWTTRRGPPRARQPGRAVWGGVPVVWPGLR